MSYLKLSTMKYPLYEGDIRLEHPEISEDQTGDTFPILDDYVKVQYTERPAYDWNTQQVELKFPVNKDGIWYTNWVVKPLSAHQIERRKSKDNSTPSDGGTPRPVNIDVNGNPPNVIE